MARYLQTEIDNLKKKLLTIGTLVEENLQLAIEAFENKDSRLAGRVIETDEKVDRMEVELEEDCLKVLALHQPVAIDLRFIVSVLKINNDLERIADLAVNIAERVEQLVPYRGYGMSPEHHDMAKKARAMLKNSLDALVNLDPELAGTVCASDDEVDELNHIIYQQVQDAIRKKPEQIDRHIHYMLIARHLERVADLATNIAEDVIYMVEGRIVRHRLGVTPAGE